MTPAIASVGARSAPSPPFADRYDERGFTTSAWSEGGGRSWRFQGSAGAFHWKNNIKEPENRSSFRRLPQSMPTSFSRNAGVCWAPLALKASRTWRGDRQPSQRAREREAGRKKEERGCEAERRTKKRVIGSKNERILKRSSLNWLKQERLSVDDSVLSRVTTRTHVLSSSVISPFEKGKAGPVVEKEAWPVSRTCGFPAAARARRG